MVAREKPGPPMTLGTCAGTESEPLSRHARFAGTRPTSTWAHCPRPSLSQMLADASDAVAATERGSKQDPLGMRGDKGCQQLGRGLGSRSCARSLERALPGLQLLEVAGSSSSASKSPAMKASFASIPAKVHARYALSARRRRAVLPIPPRRFPRSDPWQPGAPPSIHHAPRRVDPRARLSHSSSRSRPGPYRPWLQHRTRRARPETDRTFSPSNSVYAPAFSSSNLRGLRRRDRQLLNSTCASSSVTIGADSFSVLSRASWAASEAAAYPRIGHAGGWADHRIAL